VASPLRDAFLETAFSADDGEAEIPFKSERSATR
jgi:hypothetical protein